MLHMPGAETSSPAVITGIGILAQHNVVLLLGVFKWCD